MLSLYGCYTKITSLFRFCDAKFQFQSEFALQGNRQNICVIAIGMRILVFMFSLIWRCIANLFFGKGFFLFTKKNRNYCWQYFDTGWSLRLARRVINKIVHLINSSFVCVLDCINNCNINCFNEQTFVSVPPPEWRRVETWHMTWEN